MAAYSFDLESGSLCLDFANTVDWRGSGQPVDRLSNYLDLIAWAEAAGTIPADQAHHLRQVVSPDGEAREAFERSVRLREAIYGIFSRLAGEEEANPDDLAILNDILPESLAHLQIVSSADGFEWQWLDEPPVLDRIIWPVVRNVADLLTSEALHRVRGCGYLFIDTSRNRSRRWCSMESCGNRAKARRHYRKVTGKS
jgi:predicted RNA-binding Zn ribbon-like protein